MNEEIELTEADEAALDAAWSRVVGLKANSVRFESRS